MTHWDLSCIAQSKEKFMTLRARIPVGLSRDGKQLWFEIHFLDSYQFLTSSLSHLVSCLEQLPITRRMKSLYPALSDEVIVRKGVFPYSYFDSLSRMDETSLPAREAFTNDLTGEDCSDEDYSNALRAWQA